MLKQGPPRKNDRQKRMQKYLLVFIIAGIVLLFIILAFNTSINKASDQIFAHGRYILPEAISCAVLALLVGLIQAWILRDNMSSNHNILFCAFALMGGFISGIIGGLIMNSFKVLLPGIGLLIGAITGGLAGGISSFLQNYLVKDVSLRKYWFFFSLVSWMVIWSIGRWISWGITAWYSYAIAACFIVVASGFALYVFLPRINIEF